MQLQIEIMLTHNLIKTYVEVNLVVNLVVNLEVNLVVNLVVNLEVNLVVELILRYWFAKIKIKKFNQNLPFAILCLLFHYFTTNLSEPTDRSHFDLFPVEIMCDNFVHYFQ
jgi:hypothetical protein